MERGSDKHGPRTDDEMKHETRGLVQSGHSTHAEEWRDAEPSGEDQPDADRAPDGTLVGGTPPGMTPGDVEDRSEVARFLGISAFPGDAAALRDHARDNQATDRVLALLDRLPEGRTYVNLQVAWTALGGGTESRRT